MSWPSLHALVNHFPIVLTVVGALAILLAAVHERRAIWVYGLATLTLAGATIYPASVTGERASAAVRKAWYIAPGAIHVHSAAADVTLWVVAVTGLLALISLVTLVRAPAAMSPAKGFRVLVSLGALASFCAVAYTGYLGGEIVLESPVLASPNPPLPALTPPAAPGQLLPAQPAAPITPTTAFPTSTPPSALAPVAPMQPGSPIPQTTAPQSSVPQTQTQIPAPRKP
ncbi:MAG: hypothetical protein M3R65_10690 [Gemmatimonadota bacterium]|nr:hypothetical protein [Gemmatimonadota bacterium]